MSLTLSRDMENSKSLLSGSTTRDRPMVLPSRITPQSFLTTTMMTVARSQLPSFVAHLKSCLEALYVRWEITHSEVIFTPDDLRLVVVEVNCRQTQYEFSPPHYRWDWIQQLQFVVCRLFWMEQQRRHHQKYAHQ